MYLLHLRAMLGTSPLNLQVYEVTVLHLCRWNAQQR